LPLRHYKYWIFDMDGTLTLPVHDFEEIRSKLGIDPGKPILEAIDSMVEDQAHTARSELHRLEMMLAHEAKPQPEIGSVLEALQRKGCRLGILTRNGDEISRATLKAAGLSQFFLPDAIISRDDCTPKPNPDGVFLLLNRWNADKGKSVIVGDFLYDIQAGFDAGIDTVHFDSAGLFQWPEFTHHKITRMADIKAMI